MRITVSKESFDVWLENPCTEYFFQYVMAFRERIASDDSDNFLSGNIGTEIDRTVESSKCYILHEMASMTFDEIEDFYNEGVEDDTDVGELPNTT